MVLAILLALLTLPHPIRPDHPRMFFNADTWPAIKARATAEKPDFVDQLVRAARQSTDNPVCENTERPKPHRVKTKSGYIEVPLSGSTSIPPVRDFGSEAAVCALAWRLTGEEAFLRKAQKMLLESVRGYHAAYANKRAVSWRSTGRINALCAYDWIFEGLTDEERRAIIVPFVRHVQDAIDPKLKILRRNFSRGARCGFYGTPSLPWYAALASAGDGHCDAEASELLEKGYAWEMEMLEGRNADAGDDGALGGVCLGYSMGSYPCAHFNFFHTYRSATGHDIAGDYPAMALFPNLIWWSWIPSERYPGHPFSAGIGDTYHITNRMSNDDLYEHMTQYMLTYRETDPAAVRLAASLRELAPNRDVGQLTFNGKGVGGWPVYPLILANADDVRPFPREELESATLRARHFESVGQFHLRSGWKPDDTYCTFVAGGTLTQHRHRDENSFVIFKHDFLALDTGTRANQTDYNLKYYYAQTVAHNAILIHKSGEPLPEHWGPRVRGGEKPRNYGGQYADRGLADVKAFETNPDFTYIAADAAKCYHEKCRRALRQFVHVQPDWFVIYDRVENDAPYRTEWLLHTQNEPTLTNGVARADSRKGRLFVQTLLPEAADVEKVGGPGKEYWANGRNWEVSEGYLAAAEREIGKYGDGPYLGCWRLEVRSPRQGAETHFLHVLTATDTSASRPVAAKLIQKPGYEGVSLTLPNGKKIAFAFCASGEPGGFVSIDGRHRPLTQEVLPQKGILFK